MGVERLRRACSCGVRPLPVRSAGRLGEIGGEIRPCRVPACILRFQRSFHPLFGFKVVQRDVLGDWEISSRTRTARPRGDPDGGNQFVLTTGKSKWNGHRCPGNLPPGTGVYHRISSFGVGIPSPVQCPAVRRRTGFTLRRRCTGTDCTDSCISWFVPKANRVCARQ